MLGSTIGHITLHHRPFGRNIDARLGKVNESLDAWYRNHVVHSRLPQLYASNLKMASGWYMLHGPLIKAANTRNLMPWLEALAREVYTDVNDVYGQTTIKTISRLNHIYYILYTSPMFLSDASKRELSETTQELGDCL